MNEDRTCPVCGNDRVMTAQEARAVHRTSLWGGKPSMLDYSELVCEYCKAVRINGDWTRMQSVYNRARELAQASSSKGVQEYKEILCDGDEDVNRA